MKKTIAIVLLFSLLLCGCSAKMSTAEDNRADFAPGSSSEGLYDSVGSLHSPEKPQEEYGAAEPTVAGSSATASTQNQKLIRTMYMDAETNNLDDLLTLLGSKISFLGGYVQDKSIRNNSSHRYANLTIRIPVEQMDSFVEHIAGASNILSQSETSEDVTLRYVATKSRITALETEQTRLLELLAMAENMNDLLLIEERLTNVRTELEQVTSQLRLYDNLVDYGTVHLNITEVKEYTKTAEKTFFQRIGEGFVQSLENLGIFLRELVVALIVAIPYLLLPAAIIIPIVVIAKKKKRKKQASRAPKTEDTP